VYPLLLSAHSALRWGVLAAGAWAAARAARGWLARRPWTPADRGAARLFATALDLQVTLGLLLYGVFSPVTRLAFRGAGALGRAPEVRFFAVRHLALMLVALVLAHVGAVAARGLAAAPDRARHGRAFTWSALALAAVLAGVPWWRPLYRAFG
jgi:hypothetical protein